MKTITVPAAYVVAGDRLSHASYIVADVDVQHEVTKITLTDGLVITRDSEEMVTVTVG